jgi:hypothetical protein
MAPKDMMNFSACCCYYNAVDFTDIKLLCVGEGEQCCIFAKSCLAAGEPMLGPGMIPKNPEKHGDGEICNLGCGCCSYGLKKPQVCIKSRQQCLCCTSAASFPFDDEFVPNFVCAVYCLQCAPECGCCKSPYSAAHLQKLEQGGAPAIEVTDKCAESATPAEEMSR